MTDNYGSQPGLTGGGTKGLVDRVKGILMKPKIEWPVIAGEQPDVAKLITGYALPLILISAVASFIGNALLGGAIAGSVGVSFGIGSLIGGSVMMIVAMLISIFVSAGIISVLAPTFGSEKDFGRAVQLVVYACTVIWVAGILGIIPFLGTLAAIVGIVYALYLFYLGIPHIMKTPEAKVVPYLIVSLLVIAAVFAAFLFILGMIAATLGFGAAMIGGM